MAYATVLALALFAGAALASPAPLMQAALESAAMTPSCGWACSEKQAPTFQLPAPHYKLDTAYPPYYMPSPCGASFPGGCKPQASPWNSYPGSAIGHYQLLQQHPSYSYYTPAPTYPAQASPNIDYLLRNQQGEQ